MAAATCEHHGQACNALSHQSAAMNTSCLAFGIGMFGYSVAMLSQEGCLAQVLILSLSYMCVSKIGKGSSWTQALLLG